MKKTIAAVALAAGVVGLTACGPGGNAAYSNTYCVNQMTGQVMPPQYCQVGGSYYQPGMYDYWVGDTYGHSYHPGVVIQHNYFVAGRQVNPSSSSARKAAGLPVSGSVSNGAKSSAPAKPQTSPPRSGVSGSSKSTTGTTKSTTSFGSSTRSTSGSTTRSTSSFGSSSRSSSGGRK